MVKNQVLEDFGKAILPKRFKSNLGTYLSSAGIYKTPYFYVSVLFISALIVSLLVEFLLIYPSIVDYAKVNFENLIGSLVIGLLSFISFALILLIFSAVFFLIAYFFLDLRIYKRIREIEDNLSEYLTLVSTNLKGGKGLEVALWDSIKPKFGVLSHEMTLVSKEVMTGTEVSDALAKMAKKYNSPELRRVLGLIISEFEIGGKVANIIDDIVLHLVNTKKLKREMLASVISYVIFISLIVIVIAPVLFALSYNLLSFISGFVGKVGASMSMTSGPSMLSGFKLKEIDPSGFKIFGYVATATIAIISSIIVSIIEKGDVKGGVKYIPIFLISSLVVYHFALAFLVKMLGGLGG